MGSKNLHDKPFDDSTLAKLQIFEDYAQSWLPTFVMQGVDKLCIFDFFAGTGCDLNGVPGSPIRILQTIRQFVQHIFQKNVKVEVHFNEFKVEKFRSLKVACESYLDEHPHLRRAISIDYYQQDFQVCFDQLYPKIQKHPSLVFLDQNGIKFLTLQNLLLLEKTEKTDFLYFLSSSYFRRFGHTDEFKVHLDLDLDKARKDPYKFIHQNLLDALKDKLPVDSKLKLYPFSIKKGSNIYGIIFGAKSMRAVEKFLRVAWKQNPINGNANYDIDDDIGKIQLSMFGEKQKTKIEKFEDDLEDFILSNLPTDNRQIFLYTIEKAHSPTHALEKTKRLKKEGKIHYIGRSPKIKFSSLAKDDEIVQITKANDKKVRPK